MAVKRKTEAGAPAFTGAQLLTFDRYRERRDLAPPRRGGKQEGTPRFPFLFGLQPFLYCNSGGRNGCAVPPSTNSAPKGERVPV